MISLPALPHWRISPTRNKCLTLVLTFPLLVVIILTILSDDHTKWWHQSHNLQPDDIYDVTPAATFKRPSWFANPSKLAVTLHCAYVINPRDLCPVEGHLDYLMLVGSATGNFARRRDIRQTFGQRGLIPGLTSRLVFLLGVTSDEKTTAQIQNEASAHSDIIQGDFLDSYKNLTLKGVLGLRWITENCRNVKFVVKIDDDVFLNMNKVSADIFDKLEHKTDTIVGSIVRANFIQRFKHQKWRVDYKDFKGYDLYPFPFCQGFFAVLPGSLIPRLYSAARVVPFFWLEDVYLFGLLPFQLGEIKFQEGFNKTFTFSKAEDCFILKGDQCEFSVAANLNKSSVLRLWKAMTSIRPN